MASRRRPDGYLWIGAEKRPGPLRWRGFKLLRLPCRPAGRSEHARLDAVADGSLWVARAGPTLLRHQDGRFASITSASALPDALVTSMLRGRDGTVAPVVDGQRHDARARRTIRDPGAAHEPLPLSFVLSLADAPAGRHVWLGTRDAGLIGLRGTELVHIVAGLAGSQGQLPAAGRASRKCGSAPTTASCAGTGTELHDAGVPAALASVQALSMVRDRESNIWIGTASGGLLRVNAAGVVAARCARRPRRAAPLPPLFEDRDGNLWVGSARGLERVRDSAFMTYTDPSGPAVGRSGPVSRRCGRPHVVRAVGRRALLAAGGRVSPVSAAGGLGTDVVYSIAGQRDESGSAGSAAGSRTCARPTARGRRRRITQADGLAQNSVYAVHRVATERCGPAR